MMVVLTILGAMAVVGGVIWASSNALRDRSRQKESEGDDGAFIADGSTSGQHHGPDCSHCDHGGDSGGGDSGGRDSGGGSSD